MLPFRRPTIPAINCAVPPKQIASARVGPALQNPTLCKPVAIVVKPKPISPTTAGFAHHSLQIPLSANSAILLFSSLFAAQAQGSGQGSVCPNPSPLI